MGVWLIAARLYFGGVAYCSKAIFMGGGGGGLLQQGCGLLQQCYIYWGVAYCSTGKIMRSCLWEFGILQQGYIYGGVAYCSKGSIMMSYLWKCRLLHRRDTE